MNQMHVCRSRHIMLSSPVRVFNAGAALCDSVLCCAPVLLCYAMPCCVMLCHAMQVVSCRVRSCYFMPLFSRLVCVSVVYVRT